MSSTSDPGAPQGLSEAEAQRRLAVEGPNALPAQGRRTPLRIVLEVLREPMLALLLGGGLVYLAIGDLNEAAILLAFATLSVVITVVQENRTERALEALRDLSSPRALVIRDGRRRRIAGREVVRGDLVVLAEGDRVPADARLVECEDLLVDESLLTGESVPVRKRADAAATASLQAPGGEGLPWVYSGTLVVRGQATGEVSATGARSELGKIGTALAGLETEPPRLRAQTMRIVRLCAIAGLALAALAVLLYGLLRGGWLDAVLGGIALGMSMLPEEFTVVLTVFMAMGAHRLARSRVLTRRAAAIETLGAATVLCSDKTGTLTQNRMRIAELRLPDGARLRVDAHDTVPPAFRVLAEHGLLASDAQPFDPMEQAFHALGLAARAQSDANEAETDWSLAHRYGLRPDLLAMSQVWRRGAAGARHLVAAKGAPEAIADLCGLDQAARGALLRAVDAMAADGMRVLAVAHADADGPPWPPGQRDFDYVLDGLVGLADPLRPGVPAAVAECRSAGIRVVMITGDYPATAHAIAREAGIDSAAVASGDELAALDDAALRARVRDATVFARIAPTQKLRIVEALQANGEVVAMTGDGVNDAPSLKAADIGIAMGGRGTDVAREAASIVLLDDDFGSIVRAVRLGRRIYDNLHKAMLFIFAVHIPIAGLALMPLVFGLPLLFGPVHIAFLEMVIDPVCSLVFEAETEEDDVMRRPPRDPAAPLFSATLIAWSALQGVLAFALVAALYVVVLGRGMPEDEARALTFFSLVLAIVGLILVNRSFSASVLAAMRRRNRALRWILAGVAALLALTLAWPAARALFRFGPLHADDLAVTVAAGLGVLFVLEGAKWLLRRRLALSSA